MALNNLTSPSPSFPTPAEHLLLSGIRAWVGLRQSGERPNDAVGRAISRRTSARSAALFVAWIEQLEAECRRPIQIQCPVCGGVSLDEQRLLVSCGVAPVDLDLGEAVLEPLLLETKAVATLGRMLNLALSRDGWPLPARLHDHPASLPSESRVLH